MRIPELPEHLVIVGGGFVAAEFAHVFSALGVHVTIVVRGDGAAHPLRRLDLPPLHRPRRRRSGICARTRTSSAPTTTATGSCSNSTTARRSAPTCSWWPPGAFPTATCSTPNWRASRCEDGLVVVDEYQRTTARGIFALGDVSSAYQLKHVANHEMRVVRHNLLLDWDDTAAMTKSRSPVRPVGGVHRPADRDGRAHRGGGQGCRARRRRSRCRTTATPPTAGRWRTRPAS